VIPQSSALKIKDYLTRSVIPQSSALKIKDYLTPFGDPSELRSENRKLALINSSELDLMCEFSIYS